MAAMDLGKTAEEAVIYASTRDIFTNEVLQIVRLIADNGEDEEGEEETEEENG